MSFAIKSYRLKSFRPALAAVAALLIGATATQAQMTTIVSESFGGTGSPLEGTTADIFDTAITLAGGSNIWAAGTNFLDNGNVSSVTSQRAAYLNLGSYINSAAGKPSGKFDLKMTISSVTGTWLSLGFASENMPSTTRNFTNAGTGNPTSGVGTILYRAPTATPPGELDMFGGNGSANAVDGPDGNTGDRALTVTLDLTPAGGYDGLANFGTVTWSDSLLGVIGTYTYTSSRTFGAILLSAVTSSSGFISALTLAQANGSPDTTPPTLLSTAPANQATNSNSLSK